MGYVGTLTQIHDKKDDMERERKDISKAKKWLLTYPRYELLQLYELLDSTLEQQLNGIDLIGETLKGTISLEVKTRYKNYRDLLIETYSKQQLKSPGWIEYSKADYLVYVIDLLNKPMKGSILKMPELQAWWKTQKPGDYPLRPSPNQEYITENRAMKYTKIPRDIYIYSDFIYQP